MASAPVTQKSLFSKSIAILIVTAFLLGGFAAIGSAQGGTTQTVELENSKSSLTVTGEGALVSLKITTIRGSGGTATAPSLPSGVPASAFRQVDSTGTAAGEEVTWTGQLAFASDTRNVPPGAGQVAVSSSAKTLSFSSSDGAKTITWNPSHDLSIVTPSAFKDRIFWGTERTIIQVKDKDFPVSSGQTQCPTQDPSFFFLEDGEWKALDVKDCKKAGTSSTLKDILRYNVTLPNDPPGHDFSDRDMVTVGVLDPAAKDGRGAMRTTTYVYREPGTPSVHLLRGDYTTLGSSDPLVSGEYVLVVLDDRADVGGELAGKDTSSGADTVKLQVKTGIQTQTFTLTETGPDTGEFHKRVRIQPTTGTDTVLVSSAHNEVDLHYPPGGSKVSPSWGKWSSVSTPSLTLIPSTNVVYTNQIQVTVSDTHQASSPMKVVARTADLHKKECTAETISIATTTADQSPYCAVFDLSGGTGMLNLVRPGETCPAMGQCLLVSHMTLIQVEYHDAVGMNGKKDQAVSSASTARIWSQAYLGSLTIDRDAYYVGESVSVRLVDPDQTGSSKIVNVAHDGTPAVSREVTLGRTSAGVYEGSIKIGPGSGEFPATEGHTVTITYEDTVTPSGSTQSVTRNLIVVEHPTGRILSDKRGVSGTDSYTLTLEDENLNPADGPPVAIATPIFGNHQDLIDLTQVDDTTYTATVQSAYGTSKTISESATLMTSAPSPDPHSVGSCWYRIDIGEPFEPYGLEVRDSSSSWTRTQIPGESSTEYAADYRHGHLIIDTSEPGLPPVDDCGTRSISLTITYLPAPTLKQRFIMDGTTTTLPLARHSTPVSAPFPVSDLPVDGSDRPAWLGDTTPDQGGAVDATHTRIFTKSNAACAYVSLAVEGDSGLSCSAINSEEATVTLDRAPNPGAVVTITYRVSATMLTSSTTIGAPVLADSLHQTVGSTLTKVDLTTANQAVVDAISSGDLATFTEPFLFRYDLFHDNRLAYGAGFDVESGQPMLIEYLDAAPKSDSSPDVPVYVTVASTGSSDLFVKDAKGDPTRYVFGRNSAPTIHLRYPQGDLDPNGFDSISVTVESRPVSNSGLGTVIETETITLTETDLSSGEFGGLIEFESSQSSNGIVSVTNHDSVRLDIAHAGSGEAHQIWYFRTDAATLSVGGSTFHGTQAIPLTVSDPDAGTRYVSVTSTAGAGTVIRISNTISSVSAVVPDSVTAYACKNSGECRVLTRESGPLSGTPGSGKFRVNAGGEFKFTNPTGFVSDHVRIDLKADRRDTIQVVPVIIHPDGSKEERTPVDLLETGRLTNTFTGTVTPSTLGLSSSGDEVQIRFVYRDRAYQQIGNGPQSCSSPTNDCPFPIERPSSPSGDLIQDVTWRPSTTGLIAVKIGGETLSATKTEIHGMERVHIQVDDIDQNKDPGKAESIQVTLERNGATGKTIALRETGADTGIFRSDVLLPNEMNGWVTRQTWDIRYADAAGASGTSISLRASDPSGIQQSAMKWRAADLGVLTVTPNTVVATHANLTVTLVDPDQDVNPSAADAIPLSRLRIIATSTNEVPTGSTTTNLGQTQLIETSPVSGRFTATWDLSGLSANKTYHIVYLDPADPQGHEGRVLTRFTTALSPDDLVPRFDQTTYPSSGDVITITLPGHSNSDAKIIELWHRVIGTESWSKATLSVNSAGTAAFSPTDSPGVPHVPVAFNSEMVAVYRNVDAIVHRDRAVLGTGSALPVSELQIIGGGLGKNGWYTSTPSLQITADNPDRVAFFEYRINSGSITECDEVPCTFPVNTEGENLVEYRAVDLSMAREEIEGAKLFNEATVQFDATPPVAKPNDLIATSRPNGEIELGWNATVDADSPPTQFHRFYILDSDNETLGNTTAKTFKWIPEADGTYGMRVVIEDAAGHRGPLSDLKNGVSDRVAPAIGKAGVLQSEIVEGEDALRADLYIALTGAPPTDFDKAQAVVTPPAGGGDAATVPLTRAGDAVPANYTGVFTNFVASGLYSFEFQALDLAGNTNESSTQVRFRAIDKIAPVVEVASTVTQGQPLRVTVKDNDAGIASISYRLNDGDSVSVSVSGDPLEHTFDIATTGLALGEHTLVFDVSDANGTANVATYTITFEVVVDDGTTDPPTGNPPTIQLPSTLAESGGDLRIRVTSGSLSVLTVAFDDATPTSVRNLWSSQSGLVSVSVADLDEGEHTVKVVATNAVDTRELTATFYVLESGTPLPPERVVVGSDGGRASLSWDPSPSANVGGYLVHRASSPFKVIAVLSADDLSYVDASAAKGAYQYAVTTYGANGEGLLEVGAASEEAFPWFAHVTATSFTVDVDEPSPITQFWWVALILAVVIVAIGLAYVYRERLFAPKQEEVYDDEYPDDVDGSPFATETHQLGCPNCSHEFSVSGQKPIVTTCPNCGKKGILR